MGLSIAKLSIESFLRMNEHHMKGMPSYHVFISWYCIQSVVGNLNRYVHLPTSFTHVLHPVSLITFMEVKLYFIPTDIT